ncbi:MAG: polyketide cyclase [Rikenellaceae bacterium]
MKRYESKQHQLLLPAEQIFTLISNFENLTPAVADKVEEWSATPISCSFKAKGFNVKLRFDDVVAPKHVKIVPAEDSGVPMDFAFWIQLHSVSPYDTRFRLVLDVELNTMMKMMVGGKIEKGLNQAAEGIAAAFAQAQAQASYTHQ